MLCVYDHYKFVISLVQGSTLDASICQILMYKVDPRTRRVNWGCFK